MRHKARQHAFGLEGCSEPKMHAGAGADAKASVPFFCSLRSRILEGAGADAQHFHPLVSMACPRRKKKARREAGLPISRVLIAGRCQSGLTSIDEQNRAPIRDLDSAVIPCRLNLVLPTADKACERRISGQLQKLRRVVDRSPEHLRRVSRDRSHTRHRDHANATCDASPVGRSRERCLNAAKLRSRSPLQLACPLTHCGLAFHGRSRRARGFPLPAQRYPEAGAVEVALLRRDRVRSQRAATGYYQGEAQKHQSVFHSCD